MFNSYQMWKPDVESCTRYRVTNSNGSACGCCMKVCPFNREGLLQYRPALWPATQVPVLRKPLIYTKNRMRSKFFRLGIVGFQADCWLRQAQPTPLPELVEGGIFSWKSYVFKLISV